MVRIEDIRNKDFDMLLTWFEDPVLLDIAETCDMVKTGNVEEFMA